MIRPTVLSSVFLLFSIFLGLHVHATHSILNLSLKGGGSVRSMSMGHAFTGIAEAESALYVNPAGLSRPGFLYSFQNLDYQNNLYRHSFLHSLYLSPFGFSHYSIKDKEGRSVDINFLGYGRKGTVLDWGFSYKGIRAYENQQFKQGESFDLGMMLKLFPFMNVGINVKDFFKKGIDTSTTYQSGLAYFSPERRLILAADLSLESGLSEKQLTHYGIEYLVAEGLLIRGGAYEDTFSAGLGLRFPYFQLDYGVRGYTQGGKEPLYMFSMSLGRGLYKESLRRQYSLFKRQAYATFSIGGNLVSGASVISLFGGEKIGSNDLLKLIREAAVDRSCRGFIIRISSISSSLSSVALVQEIRTELKKAKRQGKRVYVYLENWATLPEYHLASVADKIVMPELGTLSHLGLDMQVKKTKKFFENFGLESEIISSGVQKDTLSPGSESLSLFEKGYLEGVLDSLYTQVVQEIQESRNLDQTNLPEIFDGRLIFARKAKSLGLIDDLAYWPEMEDLVEDASKDSVNVLPIHFFEKPSPTFSLLHPFNRIAVLEIDGAIQLGNTNTSFLFGGKTTGADDFDRMVTSLAKYYWIKGVVLRINSPGGSMLASDRIYQAIETLKSSGKTVYTSMGNVAASGGYYIALNSHKIFANPGTLTGSVGVISSYMSYAEFNRFLGIEYESLKTGKYMDLMSSRKSLSSDERSLLQVHQDQYYQFFVKRIVRDRAMSIDEAYDIAQGQIVVAEDALSLKMIDELGGFYDAVDALAMALDIENPELVFVRPRQRFAFPFIDNLLKMRLKM